MINLSSSALMIIGGDGSKKSFDSEELQGKLINSCITAGIKDFWLAEDIANAVESALSFQAENGITFSEAEVNSFILNILEETGYPALADNFKKGNRIAAESVAVNIDSVSSLFKTRFSLPDVDVRKIAEKVIRACDILNIDETNPQLIIELGRHYKNKEVKTPEFKPVYCNNMSNSPWIMTVEDVESLLSADTLYFVNSGFITLSGISGLFPSLKIDIKLEKLAEIFKLEPVITELLLFPCYRQPAEAVNEIIKKINEKLLSEKIISLEKKLPVYLRFIDILSFSRKYLGASSSSTNKFYLDTVAGGFVENLNYPVFVKGIK